MAGRLSGRRVVVTDTDALMGPAIVDLFAEEGATLFADTRDLRVHSAADDIIREAGRVGVLIVNLAASYSGNRVPHLGFGDDGYVRASCLSAVPPHPCRAATNAGMAAGQDHRRGKCVRAAWSAPSADLFRGTRGAAGLCCGRSEWRSLLSMVRSTPRASPS
jgi:NAD(P)-dependent dehydrogenase (short-subunit alcohol dehydrogenase family)